MPGAFAFAPKGGPLGVVVPTHQLQEARLEGGQAGSRKPWRMEIHHFFACFAHAFRMLLLSFSTI